MGTQHTVHARDGFEVCLNEAGNEFRVMLRASDEADTRQVCAWGVDGGPAVRTAAAYGNRWLTTDDVVAMAVEMIRVASVWTGDERAMLEAAALKVMELAEAAPVVDPVEDEGVSGLIQQVAAAAVSPPARASSLPAVGSFG